MYTYVGGVEPARLPSCEGLQATSFFCCTLGCRRIPRTACAELSNCLIMSSPKHLAQHVDLCLIKPFCLPCKELIKCSGFDKA